MKKNESISPLWCTGSTPRGGGGTLNFFSSYIGSGPASIVHPQKISGILSTPTVAKKAQLNGNHMSTSNGKYFAKTDISTQTNLKT